MSAKKSKQRYVLDTFAILTYMKEEPGWQIVRDVIWQAFRGAPLLFLNVVNLGEFYYIVYRAFGAVMADRATSMIKMWPLKLVNVKEDIALIAGRMKAENKISYADAYVVATALTKKAKIITGDREFKALEELVDIYWLPKNH
ncbi:MAG: type II toxin-antitoxin system VapC family toxin [bacterium]